MPRKPKPAPEPEIGSDVPVRNWKFTGVKRMTPEQWHQVPDNPRQRDTELHARRTHKTIHSAYSPDQARVVMAVIVDTGGDMKIDGHTRDLLWHEGKLPPPPEVIADVWRVDTEEDAKELYTHFDNLNAVENVSDKIAGALRELGYEFESDLLTEHRFSSGLGLAQRLMFGFGSYDRNRVYQHVFDWAGELELLDSIGANANRFTVAITAGALILLRAYGRKAIPFLDAYSRNKGTKTDTDMDAIQALDIYVRNLIGKKGQERQQIVRAMVSAFNGYTANATYKVTGHGNSTSLRPNNDANFRMWLAKVNETKAGGVFE